MKNRLCIVFLTTHADTLGNSNRLRILEYLIENFKTIIVTNQKKFINNYFQDIELIEIPFNKSTKLPIVNNIFFWRDLGKLIENIECDIVYCRYDSSPLSLWLNKPLYQYIHQYGTRSKNSKNFVKKFISKIIRHIRDYFIYKGLRNSKINFVVSPFIKNIFEKEGLRNLELLPHGVRIDDFQNPVINQQHNILKKFKMNDYFLIVYTGWVTMNRGLILMLNTALGLIKKDSKIAIVIAGANKEYSNKINEFAKNNNLTENIINYGIVNSSIIPGILKFCDVGLSFLDDLPAYRISPPQKIVEYFAAGNPVICNKIQTHEYLVDHGFNGFILKKNANEVSKAILSLKENKPLYKKMSNNALKTAKKYDFDKIYGNMVKKIKESI